MTRIGEVRDIVFDTVCPLSRLRLEAAP